MSLSLSAVVPCFKSGKSLPALVGELTEQLSSLTSDFEIILVNDGCVDDTWSTICRLQKENSKVVAVNLWKNYGQHSATLAGICESKGDVVITIDDDLQYRPADVPKLLEKLQSGADIVYGVYVDTRQGLTRSLLTSLVRLAIVIFGKKDYAVATSFRCFRGGLRQYLSNLYGRSVCIDSHIVAITSNVATLEVERDTRASGTSNYNFQMLMAVAMDFVYSDDSILCKILAFSAAVLLILSALTALSRLFLLSTSDLAYLFSLLFFLAGLQAFFLSCAMEFVARKLYTAARRPLFAIKEIERS